MEIKMSRPPSPSAAELMKRVNWAPSATSTDAPKARTPFAWNASDRLIDLVGGAGAYADVAALLDQEVGDGAPDSAGAAGDDGFLAFQSRSMVL